MDRNYLKRIAREVFRNLKGSLLAQDYLVTFSPQALEASPKTLQRSLKESLGRVGMNPKMG